LPEQLSEKEMEAAITAAMAKTGAASVKDMGKVMAELKGRYAGQMDFAKGERRGEGEARLIARNNNRITFAEFEGT
jgi:hypothetical protein